MKARSLLPAFVVSLCVSVVACGGGAAGSAGGTTPTSTSQADATTAYSIRLHRRAHVGDRAQIVFDELDDNSTVMHLESNGKEISSERKTKHSHLEGVMTTTALDARQDELRGTLSVTTLNIDNVVLLQNKRVDITKARKADDAILTVDGAPVSPELRKALKDLLDLRVGGPTDDDILGTTQPQRAGGHWPLNSERARADLADDLGEEWASTTISGETTFVGVKRVGNIDALETKSEMQMDGIKIPLPEPGATCEPGHAQAITTTLLPVDENRGMLESHTAFEMTVRIRVPTKTGDVVIGDINMKARHDRQATTL